MHICTFELNDEPMSKFEIAGRAFPAFSGAGPHANKRTFMCVPDLGPLPVGTYYIVDRKSGGWLGALRDSVTDNPEWFALYAGDGRVDEGNRQMKRLFKATAWGFGVFVLALSYMFAWAHTVDLFPEYPSLVPLVMVLTKPLPWDDGSPEWLNFHYRLCVALLTVTPLVAGVRLLGGLFRRRHARTGRPLA